MSNLQKNGTDLCKYIENKLHLSAIQVNVQGFSSPQGHIFLQITRSAFVQSKLWSLCDRCLQGIAACLKGFWPVDKIPILVGNQLGKMPGSMKEYNMSMQSVSPGCELSSGIS